MLPLFFDTLAQAESLQQCGFDDKQAKGLVEFVAVATSNLATKSDLELVQRDLRTELKQECQAIRTEMRLGFMDVDNKILKMTISLGIINISAMSGLAYILQWLN